MIQIRFLLSGRGSRRYTALLDLKRSNLWQLRSGRCDARPIFHRKFLRQVTAQTTTSSSAYKFSAFSDGTGDYTAPLGKDETGGPRLM
jgi:hypothetical protein